MWELIRSDTVQFFDDFWCRKKQFEKIANRGGTGIDCFEPIFGFLMQFWFLKHRSDTWDPKIMFSQPSGRSEVDLLTPKDIL